LEAIHADADNGDEASDQLMLDMYRWPKSESP
jgi:hypothetical protein